MTKLDFCNTISPSTIMTAGPAGTASGSSSSSCRGAAAATAAAAAAMRRLGLLLKEEQKDLSRGSPETVVSSVPSTAAGTRALSSLSGFMLVSSFSSLSESSFRRRLAFAVTLAFVALGFDFTGGFRFALPLGGVVVTVLDELLSFSFSFSFSSSFCRLSVCASVSFVFIASAGDVRTVAGDALEEIDADFEGLVAASLEISDSSVGAGDGEMAVEADSCCFDSEFDGGG